jgi:hypothetical protein
MLRPVVATWIEEWHSSSVCGSKPATLLAFAALQPAQDRQVFSRVVTPRCFLARMWST